MKLDLGILATAQGNSINYLRCNDSKRDSNIQEKSFSRHIILVLGFKVQLQAFSSVSYGRATQPFRLVEFLSGAPRVCTGIVHRRPSLSATTSTKFAEFGQVFNTCFK